MNSIYIIQYPDDYVWAATYEIDKATELCKLKPGSTYREVPFYSSPGTEIKVIAGPIEKEYLPHK